ncbi:MAG TPA: diguanylate cyclase [Candidatus Acidoferrales bacterium]|nr:diguanylate cyclase [Candidatus Acidoferrales bacterium]
MRTTKPNLRLVVLFLTIARAGGTAVIVVGCLMLLPQVLPSLTSKNILTNLAGMKASTVLCFILAGVSQRLLLKVPTTRWGRRAALAFASVVSLLSVLALVQRLLGWDTGIDQLLFRLVGDGAQPAGGMALLSGLNFLLVGGALLFLDVETPQGHRPAQLLAFGALLISVLALMDFTFDPLDSNPNMTLPTALLFLGLSAAVLLTRPDRGVMAILSADSLGGTTARRLLPAVIGITMLVAWLRFQGEHAGLYGAELGVALFATAHVLMLSILFWWTARSLDRIDRGRSEAEQALRKAYEEIESRVVERTAELAKANEDLRIEAAERGRAEEAASHLAAIVQSCHDAIIGETLDGIISSWNAGAERIYGYTAQEIIGRPVLMLVPPDRAEETQRLIERLRRGELIEDYETVRLRKDGQAINVSLTFSPVRDAAGKVASASKIARDITERKRSEQALQQANAVLTGWLRELEKRTHETTLLNEMGDLLQTCVTAEEAYAVIARFAQRLFPTEAGALCVLNPSQNLVEAVAVWGDSPVGERVFAPEECWALRRGQVHVADDATSGLLCRHVGAPPGGYLCVPMMGQGEALGVLHLQYAGPPAEVGARLTETERRLAITAAGHIGLALANLRLRETLRIQSIRDPLTGLFNRRYMEESLARELRRAARNQRRVGAIMLDLDHFKRFNDNYGHEAGDAMLRELGEFLRMRTRREDIACRYGGEEFVLVLPEASVEVTWHRAERLREEFKHLNLQHRGHSLGTVTLSLGLAFFPEHGSTVGDILRAADNALYRAKAEGRDRVILSEAQSAAPA